MMEEKKEKVVAGESGRVRQTLERLKKERTTKEEEMTAVAEGS